LQIRAAARFINDIVEQGIARASFWLVILLKIANLTMVVGTISMALHMAVPHLVRLYKAELPEENHFEVPSIAPAAERPAITQSRPVEFPTTPRPLIRAQAPLRNNDRVQTPSTGPQKLHSAFKRSYPQIYDFRLRESWMRVPFGTLDPMRAARTLVQQFSPTPLLVPVEPVSVAFSVPVGLPLSLPVNVPVSVAEEAVPHQAPVERWPQVASGEVSPVVYSRKRRAFDQDIDNFTKRKDLKDGLRARLEVGPSETVLGFIPTPMECDEIDDEPTPMEIDDNVSVFASAMEIDDEDVSVSMSRLQIDDTKSVWDSMEIDPKKSVSRNMDVDMGDGDDSDSMEIENLSLPAASKPVQNYRIEKPAARKFNFFALAPRQGVFGNSLFPTAPQPATLSKRTVPLPLGQLPLPPLQPITAFQQPLVSVPDPRLPSRLADTAPWPTPLPPSFDLAAMKEASRHPLPPDSDSEFDE
jgi:hypothetical protein